MTFKSVIYCSTWAFYMSTRSLGNFWQIFFTFRLKHALVFRCA